MKKLLTLAAIALVAGSASAVTMQWSASGVSFGGSKVGKTTDVVGYLVAASSLSADGYDIASFKVSDIGKQVDVYDGGTTATSLLRGAWTITGDYNNGSTFAVLLQYTKGDDVYWNLAKDLVEMSGMALDPPTNAANVTATFNYATAEGTTLTANGGWVKAKAADPIIPDTPEPATGALALAGIALLFRRRKA